jgi:transcriptional regulator with XRE-family HTH domain
LRLEAGWSQKELARRAGIGPETYQRFCLAHEAGDELSWFAACGEFEAYDFLLRVEPVRV